MRRLARLVYPGSSPTRGQEVVAKFNVGLMEYRVKREERKIAKYDLKKQELDLEKTWVQVDDDTAVGRALGKFAKQVLITMIVVLGITLPIDGVIKDYFDNRQVTNCERLVAQADVIANCSTGVIGKTTEDGK
jgi:hypothetical protein